jgi:hypothetical protein
MTIAAILDLDKAVEIFQDEIQRLLQSVELSEWDGQQLQKQEQAIRQAALELAGQCIALSLHQLSQSPVAQQQAHERTQSSLGFGSQRQGKRAVKVQTLGNVEVCLQSRSQTLETGTKKEIARAGVLSVAALVGDGRAGHSNGLV